jgi:hypothetical protein
MCIRLPATPLPVLPAPFTLGVAVASPSVSFNPRLCCKFDVLTISPVRLNLLGAVPVPTAAITAALAAKRAIQAYLDALPVNCPLQ